VSSIEETLATLDGPPAPNRGASESVSRICRQETDLRATAFAFEYYAGNGLHLLKDHRIVWQYLNAPKVERSLYTGTTMKPCSERSGRRAI
jgi:hypothetical protein